MNSSQCKGLTFISLIIVIVCIIVTIAIIIILANNTDEQETIKTSGQVLPGKTIYHSVDDYGSVVQTEDKTLYISHKEDVNIGNKLALKKDEFYKVQKCKKKIISDIDIKINKEHRAWFVAYEDGSVERIDITQDISKIKTPFEITPLPEYSDVRNFWSIMTLQGALEVKAKDSTGKSFTIFTITYE